MILTVPLPLVLLSFFVFLSSPSLGGTHMASAAHSRRMLSDGSKSYAVVFDAGSTGSRVHVFCFDGSLNLLPVGDDIELFKSIKPGLSSYASSPEAGANSLKSLLEAAESVVPTALRSKAPIKLGATAGLRLLGSNTSEAILDAVRALLSRSSFKYKADWVTILSGSDEGSYLWVTLNYLLGNLGSKYPNTVGVVDLGGGSVQMAYAISEKAAKKSPKTKDGNSYVKELSLQGTKYYLYVYSYLNYGLMAARAEILKAIGGLGNPCILHGYKGLYKYGGTVYNVSASHSGSSFTKCWRGALKALKIDESCKYRKCTFGGVWNGGSGDGQKNLLVASYFYDRAAQVGLIDSEQPSAKVKPEAYKKAAKHVCKLRLKAASQTFTSVAESDLPYLCMDLVYEYTLLKDGFDLDLDQHITLVSRLKYKNHMVEAAWPLGSAIDAVSSLSVSLSSL
ncbi:hypothetical protein AAC387_Pa01g1554 [Persea americana]